MHLAFNMNYSKVKVAKPNDAMIDASLKAYFFLLI